MKYGINSATSECAYQCQILKIAILQQGQIQKSASLDLQYEIEHIETNISAAYITDQQNRKFQYDCYKCYTLGTAKRE